MIFQIVVEEQAYTVEILDLHERPIRALVDGEIFEVWPEGAAQNALGKSSQPARHVSSPDAKIADQNYGSHRDGNADMNCLKAPIPGVILSLSVHPGDAVVKGQELCVLEAMKMKNLIRSPRDAVIATIHVSPGQNVAHSELLIEFEPDKLAGNGIR